jgi:TatD DNase family protein
VLHTVKTFEPTIKILAEYNIAGVVFHGFIGSQQQAAEALRRGYYLSFGDRSLRSPKTRQAIASTPLDRLFCETDDDPSLNIANVYVEVAEINGVTLAELEIYIYENYKRLFRLR